jgi:hypothetical protein
MKKPVEAVAEKLPVFYAPVLTVFRAETGIVLPEGQTDNERGEFAWWCARNVWVLERHGLYMEHPAATVLAAYAEDVAPRCMLTGASPPDHARVYFPDTASRELWNLFTAAGGQPGATRAAFEAIVAKATAKPRAAPR